MRSIPALLAVAGCLVVTASATAAPTPSYNVAPSPPVEDQQATFTSTSTPTPLPDPPPDPAPDPVITKVEWDFAGPASFEEEGTSVTHTYGTSGAKTFRMRVTDYTGEVTTQEFTVTVAAPPPPPNQSPVPQFSFDDSSPRVGQRVSVESFSYDPDGNITRVEWDFDDDSDFDDGDANETDNAGGFTYNSPGTKTVRLRVTDNDNATSILARTLTVGPLPDNVSPVASFAFQPVGPVVGQQVTVESFSHDPDGTVTKVEWDFDGDEDYDDGDGIETDNLGSFTYTTAGTKTIRLKVTDNDNASTVLERELTVAPAPPNQLPVVRFAVSPSRRPVVGEQTSFQSFSYDPDGSVAAQRWDLDGDGDFDEDVTGPSAFTTFTTPGERVVRLQVRDNEGALQTATVDVDVQPAAVVRPSALGLLTPFPIVRLAGSVVARGTHVRLLEVRAPRRSLVTVRCAGTGCPDKPLRKRAKGKRLRFLAMQRLLRPATVVSVAVSKKGAIGKFTRWKIRQLKVPKRTDRCLWPSGRRSRCPAA